MALVTLKDVSLPRTESPPLTVVAPRVAPVVLVPPVNDEAAVHFALGRYQEAYERLDAAAAKRIWPAVDERALSKAFASLESQSMRFDDCHTVVASTTAIAACRGTTTYVARLGRRNSQTQNRKWTFRLRKDGNAWEVQSVQIR
jgi:hypothetical protein